VGAVPAPGRLIQERLAVDGLVALIDYHRSGATRRRVVERYGISDGTLKYILRKHYVRRRGIPPVDGLGAET
jgi:hypothetical protein